MSVSKSSLPVVVIALLAIPVLTITASGAIVDQQTTMNPQQLDNDGPPNGSMDNDSTNDTTESGPLNGTPNGVANFTNTTPLTGTQSTPSSLAGKMRVESMYASNTTVEVIRSSSSNYTIAITIPGGATNVSFYLQQNAVSSSQNISNVSAAVDGRPISFGTANASNSSWIAFEVDHFSTREVTFMSSGGVDTTNESPSSDGPPAVVPNGNSPTSVSTGDKNSTTTEDVNGNGAFDVVDVQGLFENRGSAAVQNNPANFDFNGNGAFDIVDVQRLFQMAQDS